MKAEPPLITTASDARLEALLRTKPSPFGNGQWHPRLHKSRKEQAFVRFRRTRT
jgi:hypothetical protein